MEFFEIITKEFISEYFGAKYLAIFNINELAKSAKNNFINRI